MNGDDLFVYIIEAEGLGFAKIGVAADPQDRRTVLQIGCPAQLTIRHIETGGTPRERELHEQWRHLKHRGEWYFFGAEIRSYVEDPRPLISPALRRFYDLDSQTEKQVP